MSVIEVKGKVKKQFKDLAQTIALGVIQYMKFPDDLEVAIDFVSPSEIQRLNRDFRNTDRVTDVLSFPAFSLLAGEVLNEDDFEVSLARGENGLIHFGDMAICFSKTEAQAKDYGVSVEAEIKKLVIHSMLHLMGYDHIEDSDYLVMHEKEEELDKILGGEL